jgi:hypothetical protein
MLLFHSARVLPAVAELGSLGGVTTMRRRIILALLIGVVGFFTTLTMQAGGGSAEQEHRWLISTAGDCDYGVIQWAEPDPDAGLSAYRRYTFFYFGRARFMVPFRLIPLCIAASFALIAIAWPGFLRLRKRKRK